MSRARFGLIFLGLSFAFGLMETTAGPPGTFQATAADSPFPKRARLVDQSSGPIRTTERDARQAFLAIGQWARVQIVFHPQFKSRTLSSDMPPAANVYEALSWLC